MVHLSHKSLCACTFAVACSMSGSVAAMQTSLECGGNYSVVRGDSLSRISLSAYDSILYQPIYNANVDIIGTDPNKIYVGQSLFIPCLTPNGSVVAVSTDALTSDQLVFTFNRASAPPFIINSGIIDQYLADITNVTEGRVSFVDPEVVNRDHANQFDLVTSGQVDGAYVLNSTIAESHPLLQLPMLPMFGGSAEQTAISLWRLHEEYLAETDYFDDAELLGFVSAPAAHIWRDEELPVTPGEGVTAKNVYHVPYFSGLDTRGPAVMREELSVLVSTQERTSNEPPAYFMAHGAAMALGLWTPTSNMSVMEVDNGLYTPTFSVILSNEAWAQISPADQKAIRAISGEVFARHSSAWDGFDNAFRAAMLDEGLNSQKADKALLDDLWKSSLDGLDAWSAHAEGLGINSLQSINFYLENLRSLEDRLIYRGEETYVDQHPFINSGS